MKRPRERNASWARYLCLAGFVIFLFIAGSPAFAQYVPGGTLVPTNIPKYVTPLVIPPVMPASTASPAPAADYDIAVRQFKQQILPGGIWGTSFPGPNASTIPALPATTIWSYGRAADVLPDSSAIGGAAGVAPATNSSFNYPAFTVEVTANVPTNVRWINDLVDPVSGKYLPHLFPVDQTMHWANPSAENCVMGTPDRTDCETAIAAPYTGPVPTIPHVHGSHVQPHSDGYPEAWWLPGAPGTKGIPASFAEFGSLYSQANKTNTVAGSAYFSYENTQAATTLWYHDHTLGMTRLNVYAGPAGFWLVRGGAYGDANATDGVSLTAAVLPGPAPTIAGGDPNFSTVARAQIREIPIVIQDRSFNIDGSLFYPQDRVFFDGFTGPYIGGTGTPPGPSDMSGIWNPEAFFNTMVVNGTTWPKFDVAPARYRLRLLDGCNSRTLNLALFTVTAAGADGVYGTADDTLGAEVPFYQIGAEQGFLPQVVKIMTGSFTTLPGNGTAGTTVAAPDPAQALLMGPAERADVIVDFTGLANGTRIRMINTAPDAPFGGFPAVPVADPLTTGQVMDFIVNTTLTQAAPHSDATSTPPQNLVLPVKPALGAATNTRQLSLNELSSDQVCVAVRVIDGVVIGTLFSTFPGDPTFLASCAAAAVPAGQIATPAGPRQAQLGVAAISGGNLVPVPKRWGDPITEVPLLNSTEVWEIYNTTADGHPIHVHLVDFSVVNRQLLNPVDLAAGNLVLTGTPTPPLPNEMGFKDTVIAYPGQVTRLKAKFDIAGLYVWHCHILEHEDNEMMRPFFVNEDKLYASFTGNGLYSWDGAAWNQINTAIPELMDAAASIVYADFGTAGLWTWNGTAWSQINTASPVTMLASGSILYADFGTAGLWMWNGTAWSQINTSSPATMVAAGRILYGNFTGYGLYKWDGAVWSKLSDAIPTAMVAADAVLYAKFTGMGLWQWDTHQWSQLAPTVPDSMAIADPISATTGPVLYANFPGYGVWQWNGTAGTGHHADAAEWRQINAGDAVGLKAAGAILYADYGSAGLWQWDGGAWRQLNVAVPANMAALGSILYADYGTAGLWKWDSLAWSQINVATPASMMTED